jgi:hypothetical protein
MRALPDMRMRSPARLVALAFLLLTGACASTPAGGRGSREVAKKLLRGGVAEFRVTSYNGRVLKGRVLLGATIDPLVIDGRLYEWKDVELEKVRECGTAEELTYWAMEYLPRPPRPDEIVTLSRGYWHGEDVVFPLFNPRTGLGPDCFEADLVLRAMGGRIAATLPIRVVLTNKPPAPPDGGTEQPKPPASDAGAP